MTWFRCSGGAGNDNRIIIDDQDVAIEIETVYVDSSDSNNPVRYVVVSAGGVD